MTRNTDIATWYKSTVIHQPLYKGKRTEADCRKLKMEREVMYGEIDGEVVEIIPDDPKIYEEIAKEEACRIEHVISDDTVTRIKDFTAKCQSK